MQRYKYKRYYRKIYPRKRWASNIFTENTICTVLNGETAAFAYTNICSNSLQSATPTPVIVKFGRCKVRGDVRTNLENEVNYVSGNMFLVYVPEGATIDLNLIRQHPEYVIGWTTISLDSGNTFSFNSSLKRNLNSGDKIMMFFNVNATNTVQFVRAFNFFYTIQYWTTSA